MNSSTKNALLWGTEVVVSLVVGTITGAVVVAAVRSFAGREIDRDAIVSAIGISFVASLGAIGYLAVIGSFPVGKFPKDEKKP